jgi:hypothetical protein
MAVHLYITVGKPVLVSTGRHTWKGGIPVHSGLIASSVRVPISVLSDGKRIVVEGLHPSILARKLVEADQVPSVSDSKVWLQPHPPKFSPFSIPAGTCFTTPVMQVTTRLTDGGLPVPGSGSALVFADGAYQVLYRQDAAMNAALPGDNVTLCVKARDPTCSADSGRGNTYDAYDHRTHDVWRAPDSEHACAGA